MIEARISVLRSGVAHCPTRIHNLLRLVFVDHHVRAESASENCNGFKVIYLYNVEAKVGVEMSQWWLMLADLD